MSKWQQHLACTRIIKMHPDWTDAQVLEEARMHPLEIDIVQEARREVGLARLPSEVKSERSFLWSSWCARLPGGPGTGLSTPWWRWRSGTRRWPCSLGGRCRLSRACVPSIAGCPPWLSAAWLCTCWMTGPSCCRPISILISGSTMS